MMKRIIVNLKDWLGYYENLDFSYEIKDLDVTVLPSLPYLYLYKDLDIKIGAQDISKFPSGAHTGSISAEHLKEFGVKVVILNHRECQKDKDKLIEKVKMAVGNDIEVILCIDDYRDEELEKIDAVLKEYKSIPMSLAYEPSKDTDIDEIALTLEMIKERFKSYDLSYIYGGNISSENFLSFDKRLDVDGYLISTHALDIEELRRIVNLAK